MDRLARAEERAYRARQCADDVICAYHNACQAELFRAWESNAAQARLELTQARLGAIHAQMRGLRITRIGQLSARHPALYRDLRMAMSDLQAAEERFAQEEEAFRQVSVDVERLGEDCRTTMRRAERAERAERLMWEEVRARGEEERKKRLEEQWRRRHGPGSSDES